jgi:hypothetical protein
VYIWGSYETIPAEAQDYAFLTIQPNGSGQRMGSVTGWHGILANSSATQVYSLGYPSSGVFSRGCNVFSCYQWACVSPLGWLVQDLYGYEVGMGCNSGEGSSGGPWFEPYGNTWLIASNVSTGVTRLPDPGYTTNQWGPYFDLNTLSLLNYANVYG